MPTSGDETLMTDKLMIQERIDELERRIFQVCASCEHNKWVTGHFECDRKRSQCHSKRVLRWLDEIKRLEAGNEGNNAKR